MADNIALVVTNYDVVVTKFDQMSDKMRIELTTAMNKLGAGFIDYLRANKLSGNPLQRRSGALQASFRYRVIADETTVSAIVASDSPYARYHEYGFHGTENVRAHTRLGRPVRAFTRMVNYAGRPYIRPAIHEYEPTVYQEIDKAVAEATQ